MSKYSIHILDPKNNVTQKVPLPEGAEFLIGANPQASLPLLDDDTVSKKHCTLTIKEEQVIIRDENSTNGTYLKVEEETLLKPNQVILLGKTQIQLIKEITEETPKEPSDE